jgi:hypothetical protein
MTNLSSDVLSRSLSTRQLDSVYAIHDLIGAKFQEREAAASGEHSAADAAFLRTVAEVNADARYQALKAKGLGSLNDDEYRELGVFEQRLEAAKKARVSAANRLEELIFAAETAFAGTCMLAGEISGLRMGLKVFASMLASPDEWGITPERPAAAVLVELLSNDVKCLEAIHQLMADVLDDPGAEDAGSKAP